VEFFHIGAYRIPHGKGRIQPLLAENGELRFGEIVVYEVKLVNNPQQRNAGISRSAMGALPVDHNAPLSFDRDV
jgi:hypothetical protein